MTKDRIFSPEELHLLATPLTDRIAAAIDDGRYEEAKALARQLEQECVPMIYTFEDFVTALLSHIERNEGAGGLTASLRFAAEVVMRPMYDQLAGLGFRALVEVFAAFFRAHTGKGFSMEEDDEKVTLILDPCGSGGRMRLAGAFEPSGRLSRVKEKSGSTFGREGFPCYCSHCAVFHHIMPIEWSGKPFPPIEVGAEPGTPCKWHFYKDPDAVPSRFYAQVGKSKVLIKDHN